MIPDAPRDASWSVIQGVRVSTGEILRAAPNGLNRRKPEGLGVHASNEDSASNDFPHTLPPSVAQGSPRIHSSPRTPYTSDSSRLVTPRHAALRNHRNPRVVAGSRLEPSGGSNPFAPDRTRSGSGRGPPRWTGSTLAHPIGLPSKKSR